MKGVNFKKSFKALLNVLDILKTLDRLSTIETAAKEVYVCKPLGEKMATSWLSCGR